MIFISGLSLFFAGDTCKPWVCKLVGKEVELVNLIFKVSPGAATKVGAGTDLL